MNILGHLYFAQNSKEKIISAFIYKSVYKKKDFFQESQWKDEFKFHEDLDNHALIHPAHLRSQKRLSRIPCKFRALIVDLFYDHFFALYWRKGHDNDLTTFNAILIEILGQNLSVLPYKSQLIYQSFFERFPLASLESISGLHIYMLNMNKFMSFPIQYMIVFDNFSSFYQDFKNDFEKYYADISLYVLEKEGNKRSDDKEVFEFIS